ncbi:FecR domain-containing protein [Flammeovirgaceae bacterium SG7u.111]|nr:FecR domain-containing protein [Flammeovirgaceae bacterium SG7u.132]WPO37078.1 FecR domain-containing protein [Flammeovirgaceae bacterium SG7u.111]
MANGNLTYKDYGVEDFAQDTFFSKWVKSPDAESQRFWEAWLSENSDKQAEVEKAKKLVLSIHVKDDEISEGQIKKIWGVIEGGMDSEGKVVQLETEKPRRSWIKFAVAASVAALIGVLFLMNLGNEPQFESYRAENGKHLQIDLPDGSLVKLNAGSELSFDRANWEKERLVKLEGEGFFEVKKGEKFSVLTELGSVEVLGTSFNVFARDGKMAVDCITGKVKVSTADKKKSEMLTPGLGVSVAAGKIVESYDFEPEEKATWRIGEFTYDDIDVAQALKEIERQFDYSVEIQGDISDKKYTGGFENSDLELALEQICYPMELSYEILEAERKIIIK